MVRVESKQEDDGLLSFDNLANDEIIAKLRALDLNTTTPIEALGVLFDLKKMLQ